MSKAPAVAFLRPKPIAFILHVLFTGRPIPTIVVRR